MLKSNRIALAAALILGMASQALAATSVGLTAGGHTLAGPGRTNLGPNVTETVYTDGSANSDTCTTVVNSGKSAVRLSMVGSGTSTIDVAVGGSDALCKDQTSQVDLTCLGVGTTTCSVQWRVDRD